MLTIAALRACLHITLASLKPFARAVLIKSCLKTSNIADRESRAMTPVATTDNATAGKNKWLRSAERSLAPILPGVRWHGDGDPPVGHHTKRSRQWVRELRSRAAAIPPRLTGSVREALSTAPHLGLGWFLLVAYSSSGLQIVGSGFLALGEGASAWPGPPPFPDRFASGIRACAPRPSRRKVKRYPTTIIGGERNGGPVPEGTVGNDA